MEVEAAWTCSTAVVLPIIYQLIPLLDWSTLLDEWILKIGLDRTLIWLPIDIVFVRLLYCLGDNAQRWGCLYCPIRGDRRRDCSIFTVICVATVMDVLMLGCLGKARRMRSIISLLKWDFQYPPSVGERGKETQKTTLSAPQTVILNSWKFSRLSWLQRCVITQLDYLGLI